MRPPSSHRSGSETSRDSPRQRNMRPRSSSARSALTSVGGSGRSVLFSIVEQERSCDKELNSQGHLTTIGSTPKQSATPLLSQRSLPNLSSPSDDSSKSISSNDSAWSEELSHQYGASRPPLPSSSSTSTVANHIGEIEISDRTGLTRSRSLPAGLLLKNDLYVPPSNTKHTMFMKKKRKSKRERKTAAGAVGGMVAGGCVLGPIGVVLGAALGGFTVRQIAKKADKRSQRKQEQQSFRDFATSKSKQWELNDEAVVFA